MKLAIPTDSPNLDGTVAIKPSIASHLLIVETDDLSVEVLDGPQPGAGPGAGLTIMSQALEAGAAALLVGYLAPHIAEAFRKQGLDVVTHVSGSVRQAVAEYLASASNDAPGKESGEGKEGEATPSASISSWLAAVSKGGRQFYSMLPRLIGTILLFEMFQACIAQKELLSLFAGTFLPEALLGGVLGSVLVGNPVNSYVIGDSLLKAGVSLAGVFALMMSWVTVGLIQGSVEVEALGMRFTVVRNLVAFVVAVLFSQVVCLGFGGGA